MQMYLTVYLAVYGLLIYSVYLFGKYPGRSAVVILTVAGWIFLPQVKINLLPIPHLPFDSKINIMGIGLLLGILIKDSKALSSFRFNAVDIPVACWCIAPFCTSLANPDLGFYDGLNVFEHQFLQYGVPYFAGRIYCGNFEGLRELGIAWTIGVVVLLPFVVTELRLSPRMHVWVYGYYPHDDWLQTMRDGGYRPSVFLSHGLELAIFNSLGAFMGWQLFLRKALPKTLPLLRIPTMPSLIIATLVLAACHSSGAFVLFLISMGALYVTLSFKTKIPLIILLILPLLYMSLRGSGAWDGQNLVNLSTAISGKQRAESLAFRMNNENQLAIKAKQRLIFGWGLFGRSFITDDDGKVVSVPDGRWIIFLGAHGIVGLTAFTVFMLFPALFFFLRCPITEMGSAKVIAATAFAMTLCITMIDDLFNAMNNPVILVAAGGLSTLCISWNKVIKSTTGLRASQPAPVSHITRTI